MTIKRLIRNLLFHLGCRSSGKCYNQNLINIDFLLCLIAIRINSHDHLKNPFYKYSRLTGAACAEFVYQLPEQMETSLGEQGHGLSEGQIQRLAVARAVYSGHPVLILDEATSALDEQTEKRLLSNLRAMTDRTVLIVTHRPAALQVCDRTIAMVTNREE